MTARRTLRAFYGVSILLALAVVHGHAQTQPQITATCPTTPVVAGQTVAPSFTVSGLPQGATFVWQVIAPTPAGFVPTQSNNNRTLTVTGVAPATNFAVAVQLQYTLPATTNVPPPVTVGPSSCSIPVALQVAGACPASAFAPGTPINIPFTAAGGSGAYNWSIVSSGGLTLSSATGSSISVLGTMGNQPVSFTVTAADAGQRGTFSPPVSFSCTIAVVLPPLSISGVCPAAPIAPGASINVPLTANGGSGRYFWTIVSSGGLSLSSNTGSAVAVIGTMGTQQISFTVTLGDAASQTTPAVPAQFSCTIAVVLPALSIGGVCPSAPIAPGAAVKIPLTAQGGSGSYSWQITSATAPLTLSTSTGASTIVQGTPPGPGQYSFSVTLSDPIGHGTPAIFTCTIVVLSPLQITGTCPTQPIVTTPSFTFSIPLAVTGGTAPYTWTVTGPLTPSSTTGSAITLSGPPSTPGTYNIGVTVQDSSGLPAATFTCTIRVVAPLSITGPPCPATVAPGATISVPLTASGGTGNYTWSISGPSFAALSSTTGVSVAVTGSSASSGTFPFTVSVRDDANTPSASYVCSFQVAPKLVLQPQNLPDGVVSQTYPGAQLNATGGTPPLTFRVSTGNLPPGLQLDPGAGTISGTPTQAGTFQFTGTVSDSGGQTSSSGYQIRVVAPIVNTTACPLPVGRELQSYNAPLTATGGTGQVTFAISGSTLLPLGLVLDQNTITGTPQGPSDTTLVLQISSGNQTISVNCELRILGRIPVVTVNGFFVNSANPLLTSSISLDAPVQQEVTGTAVLSFTPDVPNAAVKDNPQVQFCGGNTGDPLCSAATKDSAGLLRMIPFTIPAGMQQLDLSPALQSNVAGTIQIALTNVSMGGQAVTVAPLQFTIPRKPPQVLSGPQASFSGNTLQLSTKVSSSTCELSSATAVFTPVAGSELEGAGGGSLTDTVDLTGLFKTFTPFAVDSTHATGGCAFTLNLPFTVTGDQSAIARVDLTLTSTAGAAPPVTIALQP